MKRSKIGVRPVFLATVLTIFGVGSSPAAAQDPSATAVRVMPPAGAGRVTTHIWRRVVGSSDGGERAPQSGGPVGALEPADLQDAYKLPIDLGVGRTVAIVAAMDNPNIEQDLAVYRAQFGLPPCTVASGCLRKIDQDGGTNLPAADTGWAQEWILDADMVSAACPNCSILLVEASSATDANLGAAENTAASQPGVVAIANPWGGGEDSNDTSLDALYFNHPGIAITASAGNEGYGVEWPASSPYVTAVGGTTLERDGSARGWSETVWGGGLTSSGPEGTGSGCSSFEPKPAFQTDTGCAKRMVADVAVVADPNTGVDVYDSYGSGGWAVYGGTDIGAPFVAAIYALAAPAGPSDYPVSYLYANPSALFDVTEGSNGKCPAATPYFCTAGPGYDGPTGLGTPNGIAAFQPPGAADFSLSLSPGTASVVAGSSTGVTVSTATVSGSAQSLTLSTGALPAGVTASFSPATIDSGASSTLTLTTTSAAAAGATDISVSASSGSTTHDATFALTIVAPPPTLSIAVAPATIVVGSSATLSWSSANATGCTASGAWSSTVGTAGSQTVSPAAAGTFVYSLACSGAGGSASGSATLTVTPPPPPTVTLTATPAVVRILESSRLEWSSSGAGVCRASGDWRGTKPLDGSMVVWPLIPGVHTYRLTCGGPGGSTTATATVTVRLRPRRNAALAAGSEVAAAGDSADSLEAIDPRQGRGPGVP